MPVASKPLTDPLIIEWAKTIKKDTTRQNYCMNLQRLLDQAHISAEEMLRKVKEEDRNRDITTYMKLIALSKADFTGSIAFAMINALRKFLIDNALPSLPKARIEKPERVKDVPDLKWQNALAIVGAASQPYSAAFKLMLFCGWGDREFLTFNTKETWDSIKSTNAEYFRFNIKSRKKNKQPFYSLIPTSVIREIIDSGLPTPLRTKHSRDGNGGIGLTLNLDSGYRIAERYLQGAFKTAYRRAMLPPLQGMPTPHSFRSAFRTRAVQTGCDPSVAEFAMGHTIDSLGYNRIFYNETFVWSELKKLYGPEAASMDELKTRDEKILVLQGQIRGIYELIRKLPDVKTATMIDEKVSAMTPEEVDAYLKQHQPSSVTTPPPTPPRVTYNTTRRKVERRKKSQRR